MSVYFHARPSIYAGSMTRSLSAICESIGLCLPPSRDEGCGVGGRLTVDDRICEIREHCAVLCVCPQPGTWNFAAASVRFLSSGFEMKPSTVVRDYQADAVDEFVDLSTGIALSGALWMPCGAGKTLTALLVVERLQTFTLVFVNTTMSGAQWRSQVNRFFDVCEDEVLLVDSPETLSVHRLASSRPAVVIMTYAFATMEAHASVTSSALALLMSLHYGLVILDEAQTAVATDFRRAMSVSACVRLAISATFARCDTKLDILPAYIGTKSVNVCLGDLVRRKMVAEVKLVDVDVLGEGVILSPTRMSVAANLIESHQRTGDRVVVFFEEISVLLLMHRMLVCVIGNGVLEPLMGDTLCTQRRAILDKFRRSTCGVVMFMTTVGDTAIDLPDANILVQFACGSSSHNQELQRIGRIQRMGANPCVRHIAYTLFHSETGEADRLRDRRVRTAADGYAAATLFAAAGTPTDPAVHMPLAIRMMRPAPVVCIKIPAAKKACVSSMQRRLAVAIRKKASRIE